MIFVATDKSLFARIPSMVFWGLSTLLTGSGVFFSLRPSFSNPAPALVIAAIATSAITFSGFRLFHYAGQQKGKVAKPCAKMAKHAGIDITPRFARPALIAGFGVILLSSWFSFSAMVFLNFSRELQQAMNDEVQAPLIAPIRDLETSFMKIEKSAQLLAAIARQRSALEAADGGQCVSSGPGNGPISGMIASHALQTSDIARSASRLRGSASKALNDIRRARSQADVDAAYQSGQFVIADTERSKISTSAAELLRGYQGAGFVVDGRLVACSRGAASMVPALETLVNAAETDVTLPPSPPVFRQASFVDSAMWQLRFVLSAGSNGIPGVGGWYIVFFALIALFLDGSGAMTAFVAGRLHGSELSPRERERLETSHAIMENFVWETPSHYKKNALGNVIEAQFNSVLVIPTEDDSQETAEIVNALRRFAAAYNLKADVTRAACTLAELPEALGYLKRRMARRGFNGDRVDLYSGSLSDWKLIDEHRRDLRLLFGQSARITRQRFDIPPQPDNVTSIRSQA